MKSSRSGNQKKKIPKDSIAFVPLDGLSQSARDRQMNKRTVKRPKNLDLIEGDNCSHMDSRKTTRQVPDFPSEFMLSSTIKEVNGTDYSNHAIEEHYRRRRDSGSVSPDTSEDCTTSSSSTRNDSNTRVSESQEDTCTSRISDFTATQSYNAENEMQADCAEDADNQMDPAEIDNVISKCRYSKNAAIIGMLKKNYITFNDLNLVVENKKNDSEDSQRSSDEKNGQLAGDNNNGENDSGRKSDSNSDRFADYPYLVQHPDDPEVYAHPLQAYGRVDDAQIDFRLARLGKKSIITPRQYSLLEGLNDEKFQFERSTATDSSAAKPKINVKLPQTSQSRSSSKQSNYSTEASDSYNSLVNNENERFTLICSEFPNLL